MKTCAHCGSDLNDSDAMPGCPECAEVASPRALVFSAVVLAGCLTIVAAAVFGLARSGFWEAAPVLLDRYLRS